MTDEEISNLTDEQINVMVTKCANDAHEYKLNVHGTNLYKISNSAIVGVSVIAVKDYCNDPAVMWPIICRNKIDIMHRDALGTPCSVIGDILFADHNPLRAAAIVYLKINGVL